MMKKTETKTPPSIAPPTTMLSTAWWEQLWRLSLCPIVPEPSQLESRSRWWVGGIESLTWPKTDHLNSLLKGIAFSLFLIYSIDDGWWLGTASKSFFLPDRHGWFRTTQKRLLSSFDRCHWGSELPRILFSLYLIDNDGNDELFQNVCPLIWLIAKKVVGRQGHWQQPKLVFSVSLSTADYDDNHGDCIDQGPVLKLFSF